MRRVPVNRDLESAREAAMGNISVAFELTLRQREMEISQLTQRNNFFMIFQGVLIAGVIQSGGTAAPIISFLVCLLGLATSLFQIGMAGGAKFWQVRWERATKTFEIWLLEQLKNEKTVFQLFTSDGNYLSDDEKKTLEAINKDSIARQADDLKIAPGFIYERVREDLGLSKKSGERFGRLYQIIKHPILELMILPKYSVSKMPIYVGLALTIFWSTLCLHTVAPDDISFNSQPTEWFSLVQLKSETKDSEAKEKKKH